MKYSKEPVVVSDKVKATLIFQGSQGQDGAIYGDFLFRFFSSGLCRVFSMKEQRQVSQFTLDKVELLRPHCNTVCFGAEKYDVSDEYPLLYCNIYNNYAGAEDRLEGVCCVYRLLRSGCEFSTTLVQVIRIGFVEDRSLWKSLPEKGDIRPYGNFVPDAGNGQLHAYVLRDAEHVTRYFTFDLPALADGEYSEAYGVKVVTLNKEDIRAMFDCDYTDYIQGGCCYDGILFNIAGGTNGVDSYPPSRMQIVDMKEKKQLACIALAEFGLVIEAEMIDFEGDTLYYMDGSGKVYQIEFC